MNNWRSWVVVMGALAMLYVVGVVIGMILGGVAG